MLQAAYLLFSSGILSEGAGLGELESPGLRESFLAGCSSVQAALVRSAPGCLSVVQLGILSEGAGLGELESESFLAGCS